MNEANGEIAVIEARKIAIFQKVGRNVVNLQRLEAKFKLLQAMNFSAPISKISEAIEKRRKSLAYQTLGPLTHEAIDNLFPSQSSQGEFANLTTEVWISTTLQFEGDNELREQIRVQLKKLVDDRNQLIHKMFGGFDPGSAESCSALEARLDDQRLHIVEVFRWIQEVIELIPEHMESLKYMHEMSNPQDS
jgi:hypothetical protein